MYINKYNMGDSFMSNDKKTIFTLIGFRVIEVNKTLRPQFLILIKKQSFWVDMDFFNCLDNYIATNQVKVLFKA